MKLYSNGFIVKEVNNALEYKYLGVEGGCWSLKSDATEANFLEREYLINYYNENIDISWQLDNYVDVCKNFEFAIQYAKACKKENMDVEILYCQTDRNQPECENFNIEETLNKFEFIGFDFAYSGGSFYSSVFSDVVSRRVKRFDEISINQFGLIQTYETLCMFINLRKKLKDELSSGTFEDGEFVIYKLWRYTGEI